MGRFTKLIEKLLPHTGNLGVDDAARALLRKDPEKYSQYLEALTHEYGPVADREKLLNLDPQEYYHGTNAGNIQEFRPAHTNMVVDDGKPGSYFTPHPEGAANEAFAKADSYRDRQWSKKIDELDAQGVPPEDINYERLLKEELAKPLIGETVYPVKINPDMTEKFTDWGVPSDSVKVQNPGVRSKFAAFDPRFKDSSDILAGAAGATALGAAAVGSEDSEAAGLQTIARKLGIDLSKAGKIKELAHRVRPEGIVDDNIRAIQDVANYKKGGAGIPLGEGADYRVWTTPHGNALKVPRKKAIQTITNESVIAPSLVEHFGLGPKTKTVDVGDKKYIVQDAVTPLDNINLRYHDFPEQPALMSELKELVNKANKYPAQSPEYQAIQTRLDDIDKIFAQKKHDAVLNNKHLNIPQILKEYESASPKDKSIYKEYGVHTSDDVVDDPTGAFQGKLNVEARNKMRSVIIPRDIHGGNVGVDSSNKPVIFDTSRFHEYEPEGLTPEMKEKVLRDYLAVPEKKAELETHLKEGFPSQYEDSKTGSFHFPPNATGIHGPTNNAASINYKGASGPTGYKKAAALGGMAMEPKLENPAQTIVDAYNTYIDKPRKQLVDKIVDTTTPLQGEDKRRFKDENVPIAETVLDPEWAMPGVAGFAFPLIRSMLTKDDEN